MTVCFGRFILDTARRPLRSDDAVRHLTPKTFDLLTLLMREAPRVVPKHHAGVSRRHARITVSGGDARIEDLGSKNGTTVGSERVAGSVALRDGDRCAFGPVVAVFCALATDASTVTQSHLRSSMAHPGPLILIAPRGGLRRYRRPSTTKRLVRRR